MKYNIPSNIPENKSVEIKLYAKNGIANVKHNIRPDKLYSYIPDSQTPRLVIRKNMQAPNKAPEILGSMVFLK